MRHPIEKSPRDGTAIILEDDASGTMTSLTGRLRRMNGSVKTASQPRSRRRIGIHWRAINISCEKTKDRYLQLPRSL